MGQGTQIGRFRLEREIGSGGMGVVHEAIDLDLERPVALKLIRPALSADPTFRERFERERRAQARLDHPNIVHVYGGGETPDGRLYLETTLVAGPDLGRLLGDGPLAPAETIRILGQIADALDYAHRAGIVHRDVKPQNILCGGEGRVLLADFGIARAGGEAGMTATGGFVGTVAYASPEQLQGREMSPASDVYSLACVLHECLTGAPPFVADSEFEVAVAQLRDEGPRPSATNPALPAQLDAVLVRGYAKDPAARYQTAGSLIEAAAAALAEPGEEVPAPVTAQARAGAGQTRSAAPRPASGSPTTIGDPPSLPAGGLDASRRPAARRRSRRWEAALAAGSVLLALASLGFLFAREEGGAGGEVQLDATARSASMSLEHPANWRPSRPATRIPGLVFRDPLRLQEAPGSGELTAGLVSASGRLLLPPAFLETLPRPPRQDASIAFDGGRAYLYRGLRPEGLRRPLDLYAVPTDSGVAMIACLRRPGSVAVARCDAIAASLSLTGPRPYPLGPSDRYAETLDRVLEDLDRRRAAGRRRLDRASAAARQAAAAADLGAAFRAAANPLATSAPGPRTVAGNRAVVEAMRGVAAAYDGLAAAARDGTTVAFDSAAAEVRTAEVRLERALDRLAPLGYAVG